MQLEDILGREIADIIKEHIAPYRMQIGQFDQRLAAVEARKPEKGERGEKGDPGITGAQGQKGDAGQDGQSQIAPDDEAEQIAHALAIVAQPLLLAKPLPQMMPSAMPSVVNVAIPQPRKTQKQIKMRRDENNQLVADVIEHELD
jgi:hypothetical protein